MTTEIELKAHVKDHIKLKSLLSEKGEYLGAFEKDDTYWFPTGGSSGIDKLRIRREKRSLPCGKETHTCLLCYKKRERRDGIEINDEKEFEVNPIEYAEEFLLEMGLKPGISKKKKGSAYRAGGITAELHEVEGLGWFIELEILIDNNNKENIQRARDELLEFLYSLNIGKENIESRYYTEMLS